MDNNIKKLNVIGIIIAIVATLLIGLFIGLIVSGGDKTLNSIIQNSQGKQAREVVDVKFDLVRTDRGLQAKNVIEIKTALV